MADTGTPSPNAPAAEDAYKAEVAAISDKFGAHVAEPAQKVGELTAAAEAFKAKKGDLVGKLELADGTKLTEAQYADVLKTLNEGKTVTEGNATRTVFSGVQQHMGAEIPADVKGAVTAAVEKAEKNPIAGAGLTRQAAGQYIPNSSHKVEAKVAQVIGDGKISAQTARGHIIGALTANGINLKQVGTAGNGAPEVNISEHLPDAAFEAETVTNAVKASRTKLITEQAEKAAAHATEGLKHFPGLGKAFTSRFGKAGVNIDGTRMTTGLKVGAGALITMGAIGVGDGIRRTYRGMAGSTDPNTGEHIDGSVGQTVAGLGETGLGVLFVDRGAFGKWASLIRGVTNAASHAHV